MYEKISMVKAVCLNKGYDICRYNGIFHYIKKNFLN